MLTSSDAKWRCMWHMLVWSLLMTLVSQFLDIRHHVAFFFFAGASVLVLPILTAIYSNTSGRHGAGLIRAAYVFMDPVMACITITPVQTLSRLPRVLDDYHCLQSTSLLSNTTINCLDNQTLHEIRERSPEKDVLLKEETSTLIIIQACILMPVLLALFMGRRTRKMNCKTYILNFAYWLVAAIEASDLLESALLSKKYKHIICTTEAIVAIVMIITNSYAVITLCSYLTPVNVSLTTNKKYSKKFDLVFKIFVGCAGVLFVETPFVIARFQIMIRSGEIHSVLCGTFYMWMLKDVLFIFLIVLMMILQGNIRQRLKTTPCRPTFDSSGVFFEPEKRDTYIYHQKRQKTPNPVLTAEMIIERNHHQVSLSSVSSCGSSSKASSCEDIAHLKQLKTLPAVEPKAKKKVTFKLDKGSKYRDSDHQYPV